MELAIERKFVAARDSIRDLGMWTPTLMDHLLALIRIGMFFGKVVKLLQTLERR